MWKEENNYLVREFTFKDFKQAFAFMIQVAALAEEMQHHPLWTNVYNKLQIKLNTHDAGDTITQKDRDLAAAIDKLL
jgi:4a-hydroxytetrahydrobiopterin dehydratase